MSSQHVDATFYAQVEPEWSRYASHITGEKRLQGAKVVTITQNKPAKQRGGTVLVKLTIRVPVAAFLPLRPEAVVVIPDEMTVAEPLEVHAADPNGGQA